MGITPINSLRNNAISFSNKRINSSDEQLPKLTPKQKEAQEQVLFYSLACMTDSFVRARNKIVQLTAENQELKSLGSEKRLTMDNLNNQLFAKMVEIMEKNQEKIKKDNIKKSFSTSI